MFSGKENEMFEKELAFFKGHQEELVRTLNGRSLVIRGTMVEADFDSPLQAYLYAQERFEAGTYMIQQVVPGPDAYTVTISPKPSL
jgi:hypothetical protein